MVQISLIISYILLVAILISVLKPRYGMFLLLICLFVVPVMVIRIEPIRVGQKVIFSFVSLLILVRYMPTLVAERLDMFKPFFFLMGAQFLLIFLQDATMQRISLSAIVGEISLSIIFPLALFVLIKADPKAHKLFVKALLISGAIMVIYGLFLTTMPGINPYLMMTLPEYEMEFNESYALGQSALDAATRFGQVDDRLFGRISSTMVHPTTYALVLCFLFIFIACLYRKDRIKLTIGEVLILVAIITCGVRTPLVVIMMAGVLFMLYVRKIRMLFYAVAIVGIVYFVIYKYSHVLAAYVLSIFDSSQDVSGSSLEMRLLQLDGCFDIIKDCEWVGRGYSWTSHYTSLHESHPVLLSFESLIFVVLCNTGYAGVIIWAVTLLIFLYQTSKYANKDKQVAALILFASYIAFSCITGEYGYMRYFMVFYVIILTMFEDNANITFRRRFEILMRRWERKNIT